MFIKKKEKYKKAFIIIRRRLRYLKASLGRGVGNVVRVFRVLEIYTIVWELSIMKKLFSICKK